MNKRYRGMCKGCKFWDDTRDTEDGDGYCGNAKAKSCVVLRDGKNFLTWRIFGCRFYKLKP